MFSWLSGSGKRQSEGSASFGQSPPAPPDVRGRLNFSVLGTPHHPPAVQRGTRDDAPLSSNYVLGARLGEYHRSRQNPAVLDQFISSQSPQSLYKNSPTVRSTSERFNLFPSPATHSIMTGVSPLSRRTHTPFRRSPFHSSATPSPFSTGLVGMAVRSRLRNSETQGISPVMVHLPGTSSIALSESAKETTSQSISGGEEVNPCDRDVVISALKQKRKRWVCHTGDDVIGNAESSQPAAKRSRHTTEQAPTPPTSSSLFTRPSLTSRKRDHTSSGGPLTSAAPSQQSRKKPRMFHPPSSSPWKQPIASKTVSSSEVKGNIEREEGKKMDTEVARVRENVTMPETGQPREVPSTSRFVSNPGTGRSLKLYVPESEYESDSESVRGGGVGGVKGGDGVEESSVDSGRGSRGSTPPVQEEEEEASQEDERNRRNRAELQRLHKSLTAVFPSLHKSSSRRKIPVFCATGSASVQCPSLSPSAPSVSWEDWRKEGEMAQARLKSFWAADNDSPSKPPSPSRVEEPPSTSTATPAITATSSSTLVPSSSSSSSSSAVSSQTNPPTAVVTSSSSTLSSGGGGKVPGAKSVTFQLPNVATSTQSLSSVSTASSQTAAVSVSDSGSGMGPVPGMGLRLGSELISSTANSSSLPPPLSSSAGQSTPSLSLTNSATPQQQQQQQQETQQQLQQVISQQAVVPSSTQSLLPPSLPLPPSLGNLQTTPTAPPIYTPPQTTSTLALPSSSLPSLPPPSQLVVQSSVNQTQQPSLTIPHPLSLAQPQQLLKTSLSTHSQPSSTVPLSAAPTSQAAKFPGISLGFGGPLVSSSGEGANPEGLKFGSGGGLSLPGATPTLAGSGTGYGNGTQITSTSVNQPPSLQQLQTAPAQQNSAPGGLLRLGQTPTPQTSASSSVGGPTFNFSGGFKISSSRGPSLSQTTQQQQMPKLIFGGATPQNQNPLGGLGFGGSSGVGVAFGAGPVATAASATAASLTMPTFNFTAASSSSAATNLGNQKLSGGIFGGPSLQPSSVTLPSNPTPPAFNFGATPSQRNQQKQTIGSGNAGGVMFNFSATPQKQISTGGLMFGGGGAGSSATGSGPVFNFSAMAAGSQTGSKVSTGGSGTGLSFGTTAPPAPSSGGFNFSAAAASSNPTGGLSFVGATKGGGVAFGGSSATNQIQPGGMFGQSTPSNNNHSTPSVFNPSLTTPSKPPQLGGFNFTPQPSTAAGFNFSAATTPGGLNFGSPGGGTLFSAGTPKGGGETSSRPVATARRRNRGRRK